MTKKLKATVTTTLIYEPDPKNYTSQMSSKLPTMEEMAMFDLDNMRDDCEWVMDNPESEVTMDVVVVEE
jgi:hypothetical protein